MKRLAIALVVGSAVALAGTVAWQLTPITRVFYTDADTIRTPAQDAQLREILWQPPVPLPPLLSESTSEDYEPEISDDGMTLLFVRGKAGGDADLYIAARTPDGWSEPAPLSAINTEFDELGPELTSDGRTLFFYSDRDGGFGGYDIWKTTLSDEGWREPVNLGPRVNSVHNDYGPAITSKGDLLYFSSNRPQAGDERVPSPAAWTATIREDLFHRTYDLYVSKIDEHGPGEAIALHALNTDANEGAPAISVFDDFLYFASDRAGGAGGFDIYRAWRVGHELKPAVTVGAPVNTPANELDPGLGLGGYRLYFSSDRVVEANADRSSDDGERVDDEGATGSAEADRAPQYDLYVTTSREVYRDVEREMRTPINWAALWDKIGPSLLLALLALALLLLLLYLMRNMQEKKMSLLARCLLASMLAHLLLLLLLTIWNVTAGIAGEFSRRGPIQVTMALSDTAGDITSQIRGALTEFALPQAAAVESLDRPDTEMAMEVAADSVELSVTQSMPAPVEPLQERMELADAVVQTSFSTTPTPAEPIAPQEQILQELLTPKSERAERQQEDQLRADVARERVDPVRAEASPERVSVSPETRMSEIAPQQMKHQPEMAVDAQQLSQSARDAAPDRPQPVEVKADAPTPQATALPEVELAQAEFERLPERDEAELAVAAAVRADARKEQVNEAVAVRESATSIDLPVSESAPMPTEATDLSQLAETARDADAPSSSAADDAPRTPESAEGAPPSFEAVTLDIDSPAAEAASRREEKRQALPEIADAAAPRASAAVAELPDAVPTAALDVARIMPQVELPAADVSEFAQSDALPEVALPSAIAAADSLPAPDAALPPMEDVTKNLEALPVENSAQQAEQSLDLPEAARAFAERDIEADALPTETFAPQRVELDIDPIADASVSQERFSANLLASIDSSPMSQPAMSTLDLPTPSPAPAIPLELTAKLEEAPAENPYVNRRAANKEALVEQLGGSEETEQAVALALAWLARHQSDDGRWDGHEFDEQCGECGGETTIRANVSLTGLATLAFLGAGHTHVDDGPYKRNVSAAIDWLLDQQEPSGDLRGGESLYTQAIATIALSETLAMTGDDRLREPVERSVQFLFRSRNREEGGWRYDPGQAGDTSVLGWVLMAMKSASMAGVPVPVQAFTVAEDWMEKVADPREFGAYRYQPSRPPTISMTAEGMFIQQLLGKTRDDDVMKASAALILNELPEWEEDASTYYWYYASLAMFQHGGDAWRSWNGALMPQLVEHQEKGGSARGSWDPEGEWARKAGRVYQTALCTLMLEVYYRYLPLYELDKEGATIDLTGLPDGTIVGLVRDGSTGAPLPGARVKLDLPEGGTLVSLADSGGAFRLDTDETPEFFALTASHPGYVPDSVNVSSAELSYGPIEVSFDLQPQSSDVIALEADPEVHHLGDNAFSGRINSQFQRESEGDRLELSFELSPDQLLGVIVRAEVRLLVKGVQRTHKVYVNDELLDQRLDEAPRDGSFGEFAASFDPSILREGENTVEIVAKPSSSDIDDFEFVNVRIHLERVY